MTNMHDEISAILTDWYREHGRELPWRQTDDPYAIWISEIILQQTRVAQGLDYYRRFLERFPDIRTLAEAEEDEVLRYWQGLGYYRRARSLPAAARDMVARFGGRFPRNHEQVLSLKGIGAYTAAAICSFAYRQPYAVVDGNVFRVLSRLFDSDLPIDGTKGKQYFAELAAALLDPANPDLHNQAMMDFGALQCTPKSPGCGTCPLNHRCLALRNGTVDKRPVKEGKTTVRPRYFNYLHIRCGETVLLNRRENKDIWQNLYEYPLIETPSAVSFGQLQETDAFRDMFRETPFTVRGSVEMPKHVLSHRIIHARFYRLDVPEFASGMEKFLKIAEPETERYAVSRLIELYREGKGIPLLF